MGRRDRRLQRIERVRAKKRKLLAAMRLGADVREELKLTEEYLQALVQASQKRPEPVTIPERHPLHSHPDGDFNRRIGAIRKIYLCVAPQLYGEECMDALGTARWELDQLTHEDNRARRLRPALDQMHEYLLWTHVRSNADRARHFKQMQQRHRRHARLKRKARGIREYAGFGGRYSYRKPSLSLGDEACLRATKPCRCWLCSNAHLFDRKTGKVRKAS